MQPTISCQPHPSWGFRNMAGAMALGALLVLLPGVSGTAQGRDLPDFADLAERASPAVVSIFAIRDDGGEQGGELPELFKNLPPDFPYREFFGRRGQRKKLPPAVGSGFVIDPSGYIVTNHHVIEGASDVEVQFSEKDRLVAEIVGADKQTDIALLKVVPEGPLPFINFGDSDSIRVGDWVLAIGNPFGLGGSVSAGIVSARNRDIQAGVYDDFIQTDAAVNKGNSGGPLISTKGEVIGVNTAILSPSGASSGVALAVPSRIASLIVDQIREHGQVRRGWLGVHIQTVDTELAELLGLEKAAGALVSKVVSASPAEQAGIRAGDVILAYDGDEVEEMRDLPWMVAQTEIGRDVRVKIWRDERSQTLPVEIGRLAEEETEEETVVGQAPAAAALTQLGMSLERLEDSGRKRFGIDDSIKGVLVVAVKPNSPASRAGITPGSVIQEVNRKLVQTPTDVESLVEETRAKDRRSALVLLHDGVTPRYVGLSVGG